MAMSRRARTIAGGGLWLAMFVVLVSCARIQGTLPAPRASDGPTEGSDGLRAGAAEVDITPPPGYPMAGHSLEGRISMGVWTRLMARAIYVEDAEGRPLVLLAADLWGIPGGLADAVAARLGEHEATAHIGREHLVIGATHTHHGPAGFATARAYAAYVGPERGFDRGLFEFLAERMTAAIVRAVSQRRAASITRHTVAVPTVARNRSVEPFMQNPEAPQIVAANAGLPGCGPAPDTEVHRTIDVCHAVDPLLETLAIHDADSGGTIALVGFFAVHATAMPNRTEVYHGDLFATATQRARDELDEGTVVALFNGAEGDVSPNWAEQGRYATLALGHALAEAMVTSMREKGAPVGGTIESWYAVAPIAHTQFEDARGNRHRTGRRAIPGYPMAGGTEDGRTRFWARGRKEGVRARRERSRGHGLKRPIVPVPVLALAQSRSAFPLDAPMSVHRLSGLTLVTLPGELTTVMGRRVARAVAEATGDTDRVVTVGLAGEYLSYFSTPEEYALQHYEGASTLYGPASGPLLAHHLAGIARARAKLEDREFRHRAGLARTFGPTRRAVRRRTDGVVDRVLAQLDALPRSKTVEIEVVDIVGTWPPAKVGAPTTPRVWVEHETPEGWIPLRANGRPVSDASGRFVGVVTGVADDTLTWSLVWLDPAGADPTTSLRIVAERIDGGQVCSASFTLAEHWQNPSGAPLATGACEPT
jgi:neutral ceramidase